MNGVIGMSELLLDTPLDSMQRDYAESIRDSGNALLTVINDILDFSKVQAGKLELELLEVDLRDTVEDVARLLSIHAHAKGLEVIVQIDPQLPQLVRADAGRVRQILLSLAGTAIKRTRAGEVALQIEVLESVARGTHVRCEVRDTGSVDPATTRKFGGTGLGLSIVGQLTELMGGETGADSTRAVGSTSWFTAWFGPVTRDPQTFSAPSAALRGQRVIMVDDNATNRKVLMGQLLQCGVDPVSAGCAGEALMLMRQAAAAGRPFDAALLDYQMPDCDGAELGRIILNDDTLDCTRLVLLTSSGQRGEGQLFADIGFAGYLLKPVAQRDLTECLKLALASGADTWRRHAQPIITRHALRVQRSHFLEKYLPGTFPDTSAAQEPPVDWESLLDSFGGDTAFARKLVELFVANGNKLMASIPEALRRGDYEAVRAAAEEIKGATANMRAVAANSVAALCEAAAGSQDVGQASALAEKLKDEMQRTIAYLQFKLA
jgi:CheY-like chemotaxis protein/HPt (histidine-containing phosphotransfer) domain-containing protein